MPRQNRVTPFGEIVAIPERGTMMGNRGILHDPEGRVRRAWAGKAWISCVLDFRGRRDPVMAPGHYTRLFFLDEPTALAAGHRPCAYCRRDEYNAFRAAWADGHGQAGFGAKPLAVEMDGVLHQERLGPGGAKRLHRADIESLPDATFVTPSSDRDGAERPRGPSTGGEAWTGPSRDGGDAPGLDAYLVWGGRLWRWSPGGYTPATLDRSGPMVTLTPPSIVAALAHGFVPRPPVGLS